MRQLLLAVAVTATLAGCSRVGPSELLDTAKLEETQRNVPHARKLYQDVIDGYPGSPEAAEAKKRLAALGPGPAAE